MTNPYIHLKKRGVRGVIPSEYEFRKIFDRSGEHICILIGQLDELAFDYGFEVSLKSGQSIKKLPGQGSGWFNSPFDAELFALHAILIAFNAELSVSAADAINLRIKTLLTPTLDI